MTPSELIVFGITLFLALALLLTWKERRHQMAARVNRGLRGYVSGRSLVPAPTEVDSESDEELSVA